LNDTENHETPASNALETQEAVAVVGSQILLKNDVNTVAMGLKMDCDDNSKHQEDVAGGTSEPVAAVQPVIWDTPYFSDRLAEMVLYRCRICEARVEQLQEHLQDQHSITVRQYSQTYQGSAMDSQMVHHRYDLTRLYCHPIAEAILRGCTLGAKCISSLWVI
jgi:hypothetical protein